MGVRPQTSVRHANTTRSRRASRSELKEHDLIIAGGATVQLAAVTSNYLNDFSAGTSPGDTADFSGTTGWQYLWNAPSDWDLLADPVSDDASNGALGSIADYELLVWTGSQWTADGNDTDREVRKNGATRLDLGTSGKICPL